MNLETQLLIIHNHIKAAIQDTTRITLCLDGDAIIRSEHYVAINDAFRVLPYTTMVDLTNDYGLLPLVFILPGIDEIHTRMLNDMDYSGHIRYIQILLQQLSKDDLAKVLSDLVPEIKEPTANDLARKVLDKFVNTQKSNYLDVLYDFYEWST